MTQEQEKFLQKLAESKGIIVQACAMTKTPRCRYYSWLKDAEFKANAEEIIISQKEFVESMLLELIEAKDTTAIIFYLKTKGKDLGYNEKVEVNRESKKQVKVGEVSKTDIDNEKSNLIELLKQKGIYADYLMPQVLQTAQLISRRDSFLRTMSQPNYSPIILQTSREGNERAIINPIETIYRDYCERVQSSLRALGLNTDSKPFKAEDDSFNDFMDAMNADDE